MTKTEIEALLLFKDYTHLQLKLFRAEASIDKNFPPEEMEILEKALEYYILYKTSRLSLNRKKQLNDKARENKQNSAGS